MIYLAIRLRFAHLGILFWILALTAACAYILYHYYGKHAATVLIVHFVFSALLLVRGVSRHD
jgi:hypothetical protein